jgi:hypothetical protein
MPQSSSAPRYRPCECSLRRFHGRSRASAGHNSGRIAAKAVHLSQRSAGPLAETQRNSKRPIRRRGDLPSRDSLVRSAWHRRERTQDKTHSRRVNVKRVEPQFVVCVNNRKYRVSLELRKLYRVIPDPTAARHGQLRVIDESGEDYLYPMGNFVTVDLPPSAEKAVLRADPLAAATRSS